MGRYDVDNLNVFIFKDDPLDDNVDHTAISNASYQNSFETVFGEMDSLRFFS